MKPIYLGKDKQGERVELDLDAEKIHFILLAGQSGSGKSVFHNNLYKELSEKYLSDEIGFVFLDMTRVDFYNWSSDYMYRPVTFDPVEAIQILHDLAEDTTDKKIFIHIEECDMVAHDRAEVERALDALRKRDNIYILYSTSRIDQRYLSEWLKRYVDMRVVFAVAQQDDSNFLIGSGDAVHFENVGERILVFNNKQIFCQAFSDEETTLLQDFSIRD
jgi:DNA segregation ATPase FtsK/SpoIIIE-like protein